MVGHVHAAKGRHRKYSGGALGANGDAFFFPADAPTVLKAKLKEYAAGRPGR